MVKTSVKTNIYMSGHNNLFLFYFTWFFDNGPDRLRYVAEILRRSWMFSQQWRILLVFKFVFIGSVEFRSVLQGRYTMKYVKHLWIELLNEIYCALFRILWTHKFQAQNCNHFINHSQANQFLTTIFTTHSETTGKW